MWSAWLVVATCSAWAGPDGARAPAPSVGLSLGTSMPGDVLNVDLARVRVRLTDGFTLEPQDSVVSTKSEVSPEQNARALGWTAAAGGRFRFAERGRVDGLVLGAVGFERLHAEREYPYDIGSGSTDTDSWFVDAGLGLEQWLSRHWTVGLDGVVLRLARSTGTSADTGTFEQGSSDVSLVTAPSLRFFLTLYL